ncbi:response regulator transcription factor [Caldisalinibacter kiritimatiensis]|uniref:Phosphate regulon transcriptional regulatory protein PhoB (SphR) n=1 Tax=Caldisalinibacter kiritimatiensis TaxID=1304284 RepID=R1AT02_9FIRM|nr:response regulator transcription factor [Caldisalinibacter kiritimatiensis]EOD00273.1 Phosphate regulon transcriptional regulatory protein PhoB (SphR) [Caldisalinibacter kiritimatiensis]
MSVNILLVEDEDRMRRLVSDYLKREGYNIIESEDGKKALDIFIDMEHEIDLVILDIMLPEYDGWTVLREIRKENNTPVLLLTARGEESDQLFGFELGADEYVTKPFSPKILVARVKALLKRGNTTVNNTKISVENIEIDESAHRVYIEGKEIELTPKEYELLVYMVKNKGKALSRNKILNEVWGYDYFGDSRTVDTHVKRLRVKLENKSDFIQTVRGVGYRFEVKK